MQRLKYVFYGLVQGVGFRPFIYNLAVSLNLTGFVYNAGYGVVVEIQGLTTDLDTFSQQLPNTLPTNASITKTIITNLPLIPESVFVICPSDAGTMNTIVPFDVGICSYCLQEFYNPNHRHYMNFFTSCTSCGPRYSIINSLPYDRDNTIMHNFPMCTDCNNDYISPQDRRFHAQATTCAACGPSYNLFDFDQQCFMPFDTQPLLFDYIAEKLLAGKIIALKGIGGYHLICNPYNLQTVARLISAKHRQGKPMAVIARSLEAVKKLCYVDALEEEYFLSTRTPILLLAKKDDSLAHVNDNLNYIGVMRAYTAALDYLLLQTALPFLVATSANNSGLPIISDNTAAINQLHNLADYVVTHNRTIRVPCDDSVGFITDNKFFLTRPGRGFAPITLPYNVSMPILAVGSQEKATICLAKDNKVILSHYLGDLTTAEYADYYEDTIKHLLSLYQFKPEIIACDCHPDYYSNQVALALAKTFDCPVVKVQHHEAHILSAMLEHGLDRCIGFACDGTGYGSDGAIWGSEGFVFDSHIERFFHIDYFPLVGGEKGIKEPERLLYYFLKSLAPAIAEKYQSQHSYLETVYRAAKTISYPLTSSMGRLFDIVALLLGCGTYNAYDAMLPMQLESIVDTKETGYYHITLKSDSMFTVSAYDIIAAVLVDYCTDVPAPIIAARFHRTIAHIITTAALAINQQCHLTNVVLSGGVMQNRFLLHSTSIMLTDVGFSVYHNNLVPTNDSGIAVGQISYILRQMKGVL